MSGLCDEEWYIGWGKLGDIYLGKVVENLGCKFCSLGLGLLGLVIKRASFAYLGQRYYKFIRASFLKECFLI